MTVAFVGYWLAPILLIAKGVGSFIPSRFKSRVEGGLIAINVVVGGYGLVFWIAALANGDGVFLPESATCLDYVLGTSGLILFLATALFAYVFYIERKALNADLWFTRWAFSGGIAGLVLWALQTALH